MFTIVISTFCSSSCTFSVVVCVLCIARISQHGNGFQMGWLNDDENCFQNMYNLICSDGYGYSIINIRLYPICIPSIMVNKQTSPSFPFVTLSSRQLLA